MNSVLNSAINGLSTPLNADIYTFEEWLGMIETVPNRVGDGLRDLGDELELRALALQVLKFKMPLEKQIALRELYKRGQAGQLYLDAQRDWAQNDDLNQHCPGIPNQPELIRATETPRRSMNTTEGLAITIHALAHIEFNAINLALDAMVRFAGLSEDYYWDWWRVAAEEAYHFSLIQHRLNQLGAQYGDYPAHSGLWDMAERTKYSFADRMAMVPRTLEARGLDACPVMQEKFRQAGETHTAQILDIILRDEITHVALGHRWFIHACAQHQHEPIREYRRIAEQHRAPRMRPPFNIPARRAAGFFEEELQAWQNQQ
jgi:uncharacterized ferritin-like protein (DUF455 family)